MNMRIDPVQKCRRLPSAFAAGLIMVAGLFSDISSAAEPAIQLELNNAQSVKDGCRVSFVMRNDLKQRIAELKLEIVLFDGAGSVSRFLLLNAGGLASGKTKVRQFDLAAQKCKDISRVLVNDVTACKGESLAPASCLDMIVPTTSTSIQLVK